MENFDNRFDDRFLDRDEQDEVARKLREEKQDATANSANSGQADETGEGESDAEGESKPFSERLGRARQVARMNLENLEAEAKKKLKSAVTAPAKQGLNKLLQQAWLNIIDSFGLTLIWINLHVFLKWVLGEDLFCKLGEEWLPKQATQAGGDAAKTASKGFGLLEVIVLLILDLIILAVILIILAIIVIIVQFMQASWWDKLVGTLQVFWGTGWGSVKALYELF